MSILYKRKKVLIIGGQHLLRENYLENQLK